MPTLPLYLGIAAGLIAAAYAGFLIMRINKLPAGNDKMQEIAGAIQEGAMAYLGRQYRTVGIVAVVLAIAIAIPGFFGVTGFGIWTAIGFLLGGAASAALGVNESGSTVVANALLTGTDAATVTVPVGPAAQEPGTTAAPATAVTTAAAGQPATKPAGDTHSAEPSNPGALPSPVTH